MTDTALVGATETQPALIATGAPKASLASRLQRLAHELAKAPVELRVDHHFSPGVYAREMRIPAGVAVVGKVHKHENMLIMSHGEAELLVDGEPQRVRAPFIWVSPPGTQRAVCAITPCTFISVHGTDKTDLAEIEEEFIAQNMLEYEQFRLTCAAEGEK